MRFYHVLVVVLCGFLKRSFAQDRNLTDYRARSRAYDLEHKYNLTHARKGRHAVREAVNFLMGQEEVAKSSLVTPANVKKNRTKCLSKDDCPVCVVSMTAIINEGTFEYQGVDALPPYPAKCWSQSVRYHVAPECEREEASRGVIPIYKWRWTLQSAKDGYCIMPNPSPPEVAKAYFHRAEKLDSIISPAANSNTEKVSAPKKKDLVVLMLGLSFMGQPWQSLGCLYSDLVVGGAMSTEKAGGELVLPVLDIKKNGGVCSGYPLSKIPYYHPPELHQNYTTPTQHSESCSADHAYVVYGSKDPSQPTAKVCFVYTFNVQKNVKPGSPLPCGLKWSEIDVILTLPNHDEIKLWMTNSGADAAGALNHVKIVSINKIFEGLMTNQLAAAYRASGFNPLARDDFLAKFKKCGPTGADVHYRLPGMTDFAVQAWFSLIATGLGTEEDNHRKKTVKTADYWA